MSALPNPRPLLSGGTLAAASSDHNLAQMGAELDAYRAEVERLQIALNQIERTALAAKTTHGTLAYCASLSANAFETIAQIAAANSNRQAPYVRIVIGPAQPTKTPTATLVQDIKAGMLDEMKAALERHQQHEGEVRQDCERMQAEFGKIVEEARVARYPDCQCLNGRCRECYAALGRIIDLAQAAPWPNGVPF